MADFSLHAVRLAARACRVTRLSLAIGLLLGVSTPTTACIWDSDTLEHERAASPLLAQAILGHFRESPDTAKLGERITRLRAEPHESDPAWWNDLAGAHIRLGEPQQAERWGSSD